MIFELIATVVAGFGAAGIVMLLRRVSGNRLPKWTISATAGLAMIAYAIWSEYTWVDRTVNGLPPGLLVVQMVEEEVAWKPWTYWRPQVSRLVTVDKANAQTNPNVANVLLVDLYFFARWKAPAQVPQLVHCATGARADVTDAALDDPAQAGWIPIGPDNRLQKVLCAP